MGRLTTFLTNSLAITQIKKLVKNWMNCTIYLIQNL